MNRRDFIQAGMSIGFGGVLLPSSKEALGDVARADALPQMIEDLTDWLLERLQTRGNEPIRIPAGDFKISRPLDVSGRQLTGAGAEQTRLIYVGQADTPFLSVSCSAHASSEIRDLTLIRSADGGGTAIFVDSDRACYFDYRRRLLIDNVTFRGVNVKRGVAGWISTPSWQCCIDLGDAWGVYISRIDAVGAYDIRLPATQFDKSVFLRTNAQGGILSARISSVTATSFYRGIEIGARTFFFISDCDFAACCDGIISVHGPKDGFSEGRIVQSLINAQRVGIHLYKTAWREISGVAINRHKEGYKSGDWVGMRLDGVFKSWINRIRFQVDVTRGEFRGEGIGLQLRQCSDLIVSECMFGLGLDCDVQQAGSQRISLSNNLNHAPSLCGQ
ncbi:hypothetical protein [Cupriavidus taiwanensis]|uniref:hypothetical protein n=1 Tax=Cupriavidus taiwanensis TaxID=164546 RepID=UPI0011C0729B|nr:hypothetical protein [Cupriavidus taiwanensis]